MSVKQKQFVFLAFALFLDFITLGLWLLEKQYYEDVLFDDLNSIYRSLGHFFGYLAIVFLSLNFILAARYSFIEKRFLALDKLYRIHMFNGISAYIFLLLHPLLLALPYIAEGAIFQKYFIPFSTNNLDRNLGIIGFWILTVIIFFAGGRRIPYQIWKTIHSIIGMPLLLGGAHAILIGENSRYLPLDIWIYFWVLFGVVSYIYKTFLYDLLGPTTKYKVSSINIKGDVIDFFLKPLKKKMHFKSGQFSFIKVLNNKKILSEPHPYTMSNSPSGNEIRFVIKNLGDWSKSLFNLKVGDRVNLAGPYGHFYQGKFKSCSRQVWIGGGIGITPFLSMLQDEAVTKSCDKIKLIYSANKKGEDVFAEEIKNASKEVSHIETYLHLSDEMGYINEKYLKEICENKFENTLFLLCGPSLMLESIKKTLRQNGVKENLILFEYFEFK